MTTGVVHDGLDVPVQVTLGVTGSPGHLGVRAAQGLRMERSGVGDLPGSVQVPGLDQVEDG